MISDTGSGASTTVAATADPREIAVLLSGGLDSAILTAHLVRQGWRVHPIYVRCGLRWERAELHSLRRFLRRVAAANLHPLTRLKLPLTDLYQGHWSLTGNVVPGADSPDEAVFLPGRNSLLAIKAVLWCQLRGVDRLALAPLGTSPFPDAAPDFLTQLGELLSAGGPRRIHIESPFAAFDKAAVMQLGTGLPLELTFSCIDPAEGLHCGRCNKCFERREAFRAARLPDPTRYFEEPRAAGAPGAA